MAPCKQAKVSGKQRRTDTDNDFIILPQFHKYFREGLGFFTKNGSTGENQNELSGS